jgi:hypothetical protein
MIPQDVLPQLHVVAPTKVKQIANLIIVANGQLVKDVVAGKALKFNNERLPTNSRW